MPNVSTEKLLGGHCMLAVGYLSGSQGDVTITTRNSWGSWVGLYGYHNIPLEYFLNTSLCMDLWTIRQEEIADDVEPPKPEPVAPPEPPKPEPVTPSEPPKPEPVTPSELGIWSQPTTYVVIFFILMLILFTIL